ncbi:uncharacterized protein PFD1115c-like [Portunus trituberculatus]|uniref:uncharacterized protein PFD1115c-like n=1 Tax=Portunus trituberculatus TaxID=210409 RepID=UPI001E1D1A9A|nr:uncharacterized protein PFD1115c-like [Portunus trituberculatus]
MERNIPHVLDVFTCSPRARRRALHTDLDQVSKVEEQKNPGSDSAVSVDSSEDEGANISKYFDYLNEDDDMGGGSASRRKKKKMQGKENQGKENHKENLDKNHKEEKNKKKDDHERSSRKEDFEKDIRHIERHLSMKKTIRKKMMRDLQQAFVEDPGEFQQDPNRMEPEKKNNINIRNLTISKGRLSKSEHNFLDMLKDEKEAKEKKKDRKGYRDIMNNNKNSNKGAVLNDDDSGNGSPSRGLSKAASKEDLIEAKEAPKEAQKEEKKIGFWKKLTGKGKSKR